MFNSYDMVPVTYKWIEAFPEEAYQVCIWLPVPLLLSLLIVLVGATQNKRSKKLVLNSLTWRQYNHQVKYDLFWKLQDFVFPTSL